MWPSRPLQRSLQDGPSSLGFDRQWWFVLYAVLPLVINPSPAKLYCRYICLAGAVKISPSCATGLAQASQGVWQPCQLCARSARSRPSTRWRINANECHYCLGLPDDLSQRARASPPVMKTSRSSVAPKDRWALKRGYPSAIPLKPE